MTNRPRPSLASLLLASLLALGTSPGTAAGLLHGPVLAVATWSASEPQFVLNEQDIQAIEAQEGLEFWIKLTPAAAQRLHAFGQKHANHRIKVLFKQETLIEATDTASVESDVIVTKATDATHAERIQKLLGSKSR